MMGWGEYAKIIVGLVVITDPLGAIPLFVSLTANQPDPERKRTADIACFSVAIILVASCFVGEWILKIFGISIASFRVGGGILLLLLSIAMMQAKVIAAKQTEKEAEEATEKEHVAVVPLAIPLIAGPGAISLAIIYGERVTGALNTVFLVASCVLVAAIMWGALRLSMRISRVLGQTGINIATRIMGLILAALAIEFIASGYKVLFK